ncbi:hypothetical protein [Psychrobacillus lasiicapitis]|uniref:hypothetical protein n=1 Tax=Psychrobacillus lasiicapitis TaxID=1636719 RepID=UPI001B871326|nr:hypothetical protein [Psychrobacillus lasiicapitis]
MVLILIVTLIYLTGCSEGNNPSSKNEFSGHSKNIDDLPQQEENIVDDVNLDYINWFRNHSETILRTSTEEVANSIGNYNSNDLTNTMNKIEELINQANSMDFSDPTGELKIIHSKYLDSLSVLEETTTIAESLFLESGAIDEEQRKLLTNTILNWQRELMPVICL